MHAASSSPPEFPAVAPPPRFGFCEIRFVITLVILAAAIRIFAASNLACISRDGVHFITYAKQLVEDPIPTLRTTTKQPGYPYLLIAVHRIFGSSFHSDVPLTWQYCGQLLATFGGIISTVLIYLLTRRLFNDRIGRIAAIFACFWPHGVELSADVLSDMPHLALYLGALLLAFRGITKPHLRTFAFTGAIAGLAYLLRQEALGLILAVSICLVWTPRDRPLARRATDLLALWACFALIVAPYTIAAGRMMPNKTIHDLLFGDAAYSQFADSLAGIHPIAPWQAPFRMIGAWSKSGRYVISTLVILYILLRPQPRAERSGQRLLLLAVLLQLVAVQLRVKSFSEISSRYLAIPLALSIPYAAAGFNGIINMIVRRRSAQPRSAVVSIWIAGFLVALAPMLYYIARPTNYIHAALRDVGSWLTQHAKPEEKILAADDLDQLMFYADRTYPDTTWIKHSANAELPRILAYLRRREPNWFVALARPTQKSDAPEPPYLSFALKGEIPQLQPVFSTGSAQNAAHVFRVISKTTLSP